MIKLTKQAVLEVLLHSPLELKPSQNRISLPLLNRLYRKVLIGLSLGGIKVNEGLIIDGHHKYLAFVFAKQAFDIFPSYTSSATTMYEWKEVQIDENDWDSIDWVRLQNYLDAKTKNISLEELERLLD